MTEQNDKSIKEAAKRQFDESAREYVHAKNAAKRAAVKVWETRQKFKQTMRWFAYD